MKAQGGEGGEGATWPALMPDSVLREPGRKRNASCSPYSRMKHYIAPIYIAEPLRTWLTWGAARMGAIRVLTTKRQAGRWVGATAMRRPAIMVADCIFSKWF